MHVYKVTLQEYLSSQCIYGGCSYNIDGSCCYDDEDFLAEIEEMLDDKTVNRKKETIPCNPKVDEDCCPYCGSEIKIWHDKTEWHGFKIPLSTYYCIKGCF